MNKQWMKIVFAASAVYDGVVSLAFLLFGPSLYDYVGIERPNHMGYVQFPALLLIVFAVLYGRIASDPARWRDLIPYGIGLKVSYSIVVFYHWFAGGIPAFWVPFAWLDIAFVIFFVQAWRKLGAVNRATA